MHELAVCDGLIRQVCAVAAEHKATRVTRIALQVGPLSGIEAPQLAQAFTIAGCGSVAEDAELEIEIPPIRVWCEACGVETEAAVNRIVCGQCGGWRVELRSGNEMILKSLQLLKD
jgi:hydrogenase nickel incorporation protein HypA/HybF